mgnify:CR=1 FL=1
MKCVKDNKTGEVKRMTDASAELLVKAFKSHSYVRKAEWKAAGRQR